MQRLPFPDTETLTPQVRKMLGDLPINIVRMAANASPQVFEAQGRMGMAVSGELAFSPAIREAVILRVGHLSASAYELHHHLAIARGLGVAEPALEALARQDYQALDPDMAAAAAFTDEVVQTTTCSDATLEAVRISFGERGVLDLILLIGVYMAVARVIAVSGIPIDESALTAVPQS